MCIRDSPSVGDHPFRGFPPCAPHSVSSALNRIRFMPASVAVVGKVSSVKEHLRDRHSSALLIT
eukprot:2843397-Alexandrium_andersonii.AAC.1